ncbi:MULTISPECIES: SPOR domain-containing protein [Thalassobaculum]|uniref:Sporulation related domain-containing protein n=1 Tax=Thalassobaculum litoreum DSM 18839 TaxID=1123362 RepID=A0A8G2BLQ6_9PROT|nr:MULTISPECIES: SPOR domain-containing protein [Thalassobaculum]SDG43509.1 Sporulation related domain-containing protein [Thalassobaculum litoreum DSM 18839]
MKRIIAVAAMPLLLGGCLPIPVTIASTAISGISYMKTGKFSADHVLSAFVEQDCEFSRPIMGEAICHDIDPASAAASERVVVAAYPGDRDNGSFRSNNDPVISLGAMKIDGVQEEPTVVAAALSVSPPPRAPIETPGLAKPEASSLAVLAAPKSAVPASMPPVPIARPASISSTVAAPATSVSAPIDPWTPPAGYTRGDRSARAMPAALTAAAPIDAPVDVFGQATASSAPRYIVVGSVRESGRAKGLAERFADRKAEIQSVEVDGHVWHRVLIGPYGLQEARVARSDLGEVDGQQPWIIRRAPHADQVAMR